jgi:hypothetical protein
LNFPHPAQRTPPDKTRRQRIYDYAATPYLEKGPLTKLADPREGVRLNNAFGGPFNLLGFGFWFN